MKKTTKQINAPAPATQRNAPAPALKSAVAPKIKASPRRVGLRRS